MWFGQFEGGSWQGVEEALKNLRVGEKIQANQTLITLVPADLCVKTAVAEDRLGDLPPGTEAKVTNLKTGSCSGSTVTGLDYDLQGNLYNKNGQLHDFDYGNRLREVMGVERYRYDAHGRRILAMNFASGTITSQYGGNGQLLYQQNARSGENKEIDHIYLAGSLIAMS